MTERIKEVIRKAYEEAGREIPEFYVRETETGYTILLSFTREDYEDKTELLSIVAEILRVLETKLLKKKRERECKKFYHLYLIPFEYEGT